MIVARPTIADITRFINSLFSRVTPRQLYSSVAIAVTLSFIHDGKRELITGDVMTGKDFVWMRLSVESSAGCCRDVHSSFITLYNMLKITALTIKSVNPSPWN